MNQNTRRISLLLCSAAAALFLASGCRKQDMADQPRVDTMSKSAFFADEQAVRPLVTGTVPIGHPPVRDALYGVTYPVANAVELTSFPEKFDVSTEALQRRHVEAGREKFEIFCAVCHGRTADGNGMIVQRGFPRPPSFYTARLRNAPVGHYYNVISNGYGAMYSYGDRINAEDRWNIAAYIRTLQASDPKRMDPDISRTTTQPTQVK